MAIDVNITSIGSGFNRTVIDNNFTNIQTALQNALSRNGTLPNSMEADIDMDSNDLLNVGDINTERLFVNGEEFVAGDVTAVGDRGWSPSFAVVTDGARRVLQLTGYVGGGGTPPTTNVGRYVGATQMELLIANGVDIRGAQGATGAGTGDMLAAQNLNDVVSKPTAFSNIKQAATTSATGVVELATNAEAIAGVDTTRAITPSTLAATLATVPSPAEVLLASGDIPTGGVFDINFSAYTEYSHIRIRYINMRSTTAGAYSSRLRFSSDGGSTYDAGTFDYIWNRAIAYNSGNISGGTGNASYLEMENSTIGTTAGAGFDADFIIYDWNNANTFSRVDGNYSRYSNSALATARFSGYRVATKVCNAIRLFFSTGNISSGKYYVYGIK